jgi:hypothetical protein
MVHNNTWLVLVVWLFCTVSVNADRLEPDRVGNGNRWESTVGDERIISPELAWWYFDTDWDIGFDIHEGDWATSDWRQTDFDRNLFNSFELYDYKLFEFYHDSCIDWNGCNKSCVVVCHCQGCFEDWQREKRNGERKMIERDLVYLGLAFLAGVCCHKYVVASVKRLFGWVVK